jgi:hypothetical protein
MSWVVSGVAVGSAVIGAYSQEEQRKAQVAANKQQAEMAAAQTQYSPWTGMGSGQANMQPVTGNALSGALQGGLSGAMFGQGLKGSMGAQKAASQPMEISAGGPADAEKMRRMQGLA